MQACLMGNQGLGLLDFMSVLGFGGIVHLPYYGGIKQMLALSKCWHQTNGQWHQTNGGIQQRISSQTCYTGGQTDADAPVPD